MQSIGSRLARARTGSESSTSGFVAVGLALSMVLGLGAFVLGDAGTAFAVRTLTGSAWLPSDRGVTLVDGLSAKATAEVSFTSAGELSVSQAGSTVLVFDPVSGELTRIDAATLKPGAATGEFAGGQAAYVLARAGSAYVVDPAGTVQVFDPEDVRPLAAPIGLGGQITSAVVDAEGTLWSLVPSLSVIVPIDASGPGTKVSSPSGATTLTVVDGRPAAVSEGVGAAAAIARVARTGVQAAVALRDVASVVPAGRLLVPPEVTGSVVPVLDLAASEVLLVDLATSTVQRTSVRGIDTTHEYGAPVQLGEQVYLPDYTGGFVVPINTVTGAFGEQIPVRDGGGSFDVVPKDGLLFLNDPTTNAAVVLKQDGTSTEVDKYVVTDTQTTPTVPPTSPAQPEVSAPVVLPTRQPPSAPSPSSATPRPSPSVSVPPAAPLAPEGLSARLQDDDQILVTWEPAARSSSPVASYEVTPQPDVGLEREASPNFLSAVFTLAAQCGGSVYAFDVTAIGVDGQRSGTSRSPNVVIPDCPPSSVSDLHIEKRRQTSITVAWSAADGANIYQIRWKPTSGSTWVPWFDLDLVSWRLQYQVNDLSPGTAYDFEVRAVNDAGAGPAEDVSGSTSAAPSPPAPVEGLTAGDADSTTVPLYWSPVDGAEYFEIRWRVADSADWTSWESRDDVPLDAPSTSVTGLEPSRSYEFEVHGVNGDGVGESGGTTATTDPPPGPPEMRLVECYETRPMPNGNHKGWYGSGACPAGAEESGRALIISPEPWSGFVPLYRLARQRDTVEGCGYLPDYLLATSDAAHDGWTSEGVVGYVPVGGYVEVNQWYGESTLSGGNCHGQPSWSWKSWSYGQACAGWNSIGCAMQGDHFTVMRIEGAPWARLGAAPELREDYIRANLARHTTPWMVSPDKSRIHRLRSSHRRHARPQATN